MALLTVEDLHVSFRLQHGLVRAVRGVSLALERGEALGIVGESGCGKTACCCAIMRLLPVPPAHIEARRLFFDDANVLRCSAGALRSIRGKRIAMIFQDPLTSLNPYLRVEVQVTEALRFHHGLGRSEARRRAVEALGRMGVADAENVLRRHPHELSGGMRQRVMIAAALLVGPELLIADEPTTALDVTVQAQILDILAKHRVHDRLAILLVTHDLAVAAQACERVAVMYAGTIVELAPARQLLAAPRHPYTAALLRSMPSGAPRGKPLVVIEGSPPKLDSAHEGCAFAPRCSHAIARCRTERVVLEEISPVHATACIRAQAGDLELPL